MKLLIFGVLILCLIPSFSAKIKYPAHLPRCFRDDPNLSACLIKASETVKPLFKNGIKEFGIPSTNPLVIPSIKLEQGTGNLNFKLDVTNLAVNGLDNYTVNAFNIDLKKKKIEFKIMFGPLVSRGISNFEGKISITSIKGTGTLLLDNSPSTFAIEMDVDLVKRDGEEYIQINDVKIIENIFVGKARFENFEGTNENLVKIFNKIISDNSDELSNEVKPVINKFITEFIKQIMDEVFGRYSYDEIFPLSF